MWNWFDVGDTEADAVAVAGVVDAVPTVLAVSLPFAYLLAASHYSNSDSLLIISLYDISFQFSVLIPCVIYHFNFLFLIPCMIYHFNFSVFNSERIKILLPFAAFCFLPVIISPVI
jgi:hypothetical protein